MRLALLWIGLVLQICTALVGHSASVPTNNAECRWVYKCCDSEPERADNCQQLCRYPEIICESSASEAEPTEPSNARHILFARSCNEGFRLDHRGQCRLVFR